MPKNDSTSQSNHPDAKEVAAKTGLSQANASEVASRQSTAPKAQTESRGTSNTGDVADQEAADKAAADAKAEELSANAGGAGGTMRVNAAPGTLKAGANNPADGTPIEQPTNDVTRPDATKGPLHNPGVVVTPDMEDPSPTTAVAPGTVLSATSSTKRDMTDPSRKHD